MPRASMSALALLIAGLTIVGCGGNGAEGAGEPQAGPAAAPRSARTLDIPGSAPSGQSPHGTSPLLKWEVPDGWQSTQPASPMRYAQYRVPGSGGAGECIVYYFGPGQGGDARSNAVRWAGQFEQADGSSSVDRMTMEEIDGARVTAQLVEVTGTYDGGMTMTDAPAEKQTGWMLLGGIAEGPDAPWFFKLTGPEETIRAQRDAFLDMMRSLQPAG